MHLQTLVTFARDLGREWPISPIKVGGILTALLIAPIVIWGCYLPFFSLNDRPSIDDAVHIHIKKGMTVRQIAHVLQREAIIGDTGRFVWTVRVMRKAGALKAGHYRFDQRLSNWNLVKRLTNGDVLLQRVTLPEGMRASFVAARLHKVLAVDSAEVMSYVTNEAYTRSLGIDAEGLEGYLYPDTYAFEENSSIDLILRRMVSRFHEMVDQNILSCCDSLGLSLHQVITLASIIEGEVVLDRERAIVSSIYHNRLKKRMYLQSCPTIQYLLPEGPRRLLDKDLEIDSPYNTYRHFGLPPGPVGNPGIVSILAACQPARTDYLYLVAKGDGSHSFSKTLTEHNRAKARFNQVRRAVRRRNR